MVALCRTCDAAARGVAWSADDEHARDTARELECECGATVSLWSARIVVGADDVELRCAACGTRMRAHDPPEPTREGDPAVIAPSVSAATTDFESVRAFRGLRGVRGLRGRRHVALLIVLATAAAALALGMLVVSGTDVAAPEGQTVAQPAKRKIVSFETDAYVDLTPPEDQFTAPEEIPEGSAAALTGAERRTEDEPLPHATNEAIQEVYAAHLGTWIHPVVEAAEHVPARSTRRFGARRPGERPGECGAGHCGVDLEGPRGTPIVAVRDGIVASIVNDPHRPSGKYVKVLHDDGTAAFYMHLDDALGGLMRGDRVGAGDMIGSLGTTGINSSIPHLHFAFRMPVGHGDRYIDPAPLLDASRVVGLLEIGMPDLTRPPTTAWLGDLASASAKAPSL